MCCSLCLIPHHSSIPGLLSKIASGSCKDSDLLVSPSSIFIQYHHISTTGRMPQHRLVQADALEGSVLTPILRCASSDLDFKCKMSLCEPKHRVSTSICALKGEAVDLPNVHMTMLTP